MTIKQLIGGKVALLTANGETYTFLHSETEFQNMISDDAILPCVYLDMPMKYKPVFVQGGHYQMTYICNILVLFKSELGDNDSQQETIFVKAQNVVKQLLISLENDDDNVRDLVIGEVLQVQNLFDTNMSGAVLPFSLRIINYDGVC